MPYGSDMVAEWKQRAERDSAVIYDSRSLLSQPLKLMVAAYE